MTTTKLALSFHLHHTWRPTLGINAITASEKSFVFVSLCFSISNKTKKKLKGFRDVILIKCVSP